MLSVSETCGRGISNGRNWIDDPIHGMVLELRRSSSHLIA